MKLQLADYADNLFFVFPIQEFFLNLTLTIEHEYYSVTVLQAYLQNTNSYKLSKKVGFFVLG